MKQQTTQIRVKREVAENLKLLSLKCSAKAERIITTSEIMQYVYFEIIEPNRARIIEEISKTEQG